MHHRVTKVVTLAIMIEVVAYSPLIIRTIIIIYNNEFQIAV